MACPEDIIRAFITPQIAGKTTELTYGMETVSSSRQKLMHISLVPNIPDQQVVWGIENVVQRHRQFNHAQVWGQVTTFYRDLFDDLTSNFFSQLLHLRGCQGA